MKAVTPKLQFLDLSHYSWPVNWDLLAQNKDLIAIGWKASEGNYSNDVYYARARIECEKRGYLWLAYHFGTNNPVEEQVDRFLHAANPGPNTRMALDWEDYGAKQMGVAQAIAFLQVLDSKLGRVATLYSGNAARDLMGAQHNAFLGSHPLWIPRYSTSQPVPQVSWTHWDVWQYAADGSGSQPNTAAGCKGHPDCNVFYDDVETVRANWAGHRPLNVTPPSVSTAPVAPVPTPPVVRDVRWMQRSLNAILNIDPPLDVDGVMGNETKSAINDLIADALKQKGISNG